jgi:hypothetical protein
MSHHYHAAVWIDHHEAKVYHFNRSAADSVAIHPCRPTRHLHHKANCIGSGHTAEDADYFARVADAVDDAGTILIAGPANEKTELMKYITTHLPLLAARIVGVESVDHPSDRQLIDYARRYFWFDRQSPLRSTP